MDIALPAELQRFVTELIETGRFETPAEAICAGLRLLRDEEELRRIRLEQLRKEIAVGIDQADRGELIDGEEVFAELEEKIRKNAGQSP